MGTCSERYRTKNMKRNWYSVEEARHGQNVGFSFVTLENKCIMQLINSPGLYLAL